MERLLSRAAETAFKPRVAAVARGRVLEGPLLDALACAPLLGHGKELKSPENAEARARLEILLWEAGASAIEVPDLGAWLWGSRETFDTMVAVPAHGALRGRVLAARCLEVSARGMPPTADPELVGRTLHVLQPLLLHPEPLVWVHAARALGRLTGPLEQLEGTLLDWVLGESRLLKQRAVTAFASLPGDRLKFLSSQLVAILDDPTEEDWVLGAVAAATPYLFFERKELWDRLATRVLSGDGGAIAARALARGLATLWRRGTQDATIEAPMRALREMARAGRSGQTQTTAAATVTGQDAAPSSATPAPSKRAHEETIFDESRRWLEVIAVTDAIDGAERDPLDLELGLENLMRLAAQYDDEEADARAARFASALLGAFTESRRIALGQGRLRQRAAAHNTLEASARAFALRLWGPLLATRPLGDHVEEPNLEETWRAIARAPSEILDLVKERRHRRTSLGPAGTEPESDGARDSANRATLSQIPAASRTSASRPSASMMSASMLSGSIPPGSRTHEDLALEVLAVRLGGYALDACGEDEAGPTAHETCLWLRKIDGLNDGSRELPPQLTNALSTLFWRLVDTTRGTALGEVDDVRWLGPFAAWWALVIDRPAMLLQLATALPMMSAGALDQCCTHAEALRTAFASEAPDGQWGYAAAEALALLHAEDTELAHALWGLARALESFGAAAGHKPNLDAMCLELVLAGDRLHGALANPVKALHEVSEATHVDSLSRSATENAPRVAGLVARAIRTREVGMLDVWFASLGPVASALLETAVRAAIKRSPPPPPPAKKKEQKLIAGYELVRALGEGGIGSVWLVRKPDADRYFVLKIPKADALASATDEERNGILASFVEEAKALAGLYHPNVANIIDRGVAEGANGGVPYLVLEYLIGADLKQYAAARPMTLFELRRVVLEACAGLSALHAAKLVHRDIKPANLWLRLPLAGGEKFDGEKHRDPAIAPPLATVVIDFGMVRAIRVPPEVGGRFVAGTAGYIAPEQVLDPVELDPRSDVYALAGTIYNVTTGRAFFDEITSSRDRIIAHMRQDPFEDAARLKSYPTAVAKLLRAATAREPADRPSPLEFGREFAAAI
jgi:serine/threonine-protein kinase